MKGDTYPVVGAEKALELMEQRPAGDHRMGIGGCARPVPLKDRLEQPCESSASGAPEKDAVTVRDAVFGLASHFVDGRQALVPSWLFEVTAPGAKDPFTVTYPAVDPKYLASPTPSEPSDKPTSAPEAA
ncbi:Large membrane protein OS=Streptomyces violarus OX=67380 GN=FHS41_005751 PE=4 SV=1 [Streptomyces violarus]